MNAVTWTVAGREYCAGLAVERAGGGGGGCTGTNSGNCVEYCTHNGQTTTTAAWYV